MAWRERPVVAGCEGFPAARGNGHALDAARSPIGIFSTPLASSVERAGWERLLVELHRMPPGEGEARLPQLMLALMLEPARTVTGRLDGGRECSGRGAPFGIFIVPPGRSHWCAWTGSNTFLALFLDREAMVQAVRDDGLEPDRLEIAYRFLASDPDLASLALSLHDQLLDPDAEDRLYVDTLSVQLAVHMLCRHGTTPLRLRSYRGGLSRAKMRTVLDYLNGHLGRNVHLAELADLVEMSPFHFLRLFRESSGLTPHQYLVHRRVEVARSLLRRDDLSLAQVAHPPAFSHPTPFPPPFPPP